MLITDVTFVSTEGGDWEALYINGKCVMEGHRIEARDILECLDIPYRSFESDEYLVGSGYPDELPENLRI